MKKDHPPASIVHDAKIINTVFNVLVLIFIYLILNYCLLISLFGFRVLLGLRIFGFFLFIFYRQQFSIVLRLLLFFFLTVVLRINLAKKHNKILNPGNILPSIKESLNKKVLSQINSQTYFCQNN